MLPGILEVSRLDEDRGRVVARGCLVLELACRPEPIDRGLAIRQSRGGRAGAAADEAEYPMDIAVEDRVAIGVVASLKGTQLGEGGGEVGGVIVLDPQVEAGPEAERARAALELLRCPLEGRSGVLVVLLLVELPGVAVECVALGELPALEARRAVDGGHRLGGQVVAGEALEDRRQAPGRVERPRGADGVAVLRRPGPFGEHLVLDPPADLLPVTIRELLGSRRVVAVQGRDELGPVRRPDVVGRRFLLQRLEMLPGLRGPIRPRGQVDHLLPRLPGDVGQVEPLEGEGPRGGGVDGSGVGLQGALGLRRKADQRSGVGVRVDRERAVRRDRRAEAEGCRGGVGGGGPGEGRKGSVG